MPAQTEAENPLNLNKGSTMYIDKLTLTNVRTFLKNELRFLHPDSTFRSPEVDADENELLLPKPKLPNG